jgi:DNA-binding NarL/FixJ family response regulator
MLTQILAATQAVLCLLLLGGSLVLLLHLRRRTQRLEEEVRRLGGDWARTNRDWEDQLDQLQEGWLALETQFSAPVPVPARIDLTRRRQALRLLRQGKAVREVAGLAGLPSAHVRLLQSVQNLLLPTAVEPRSTLDSASSRDGPDA